MPGRLYEQEQALGNCLVAVHMTCYTMTSSDHASSGGLLVMYCVPGCELPMSYPVSLLDLLKQDICSEHESQAISKMDRGIWSVVLHRKAIRAHCSADLHNNLALVCRTGWL